MLLMQQPLICPTCGNDMNDYYKSTRTGKFVFRCSKNHILEVSESEYMERIRSQNRNEK